VAINKNHSIYSRKPTVSLRAVLKGLKDDRLTPDTIPAFDAFACFKNEPPSRLLNRTPKSKIKQRAEKVLDRSFGRGHGAVADKSAFEFEINRVPRLTTLHLCTPEYLSHLQQSMRRGWRRKFKFDDGFGDVSKQARAKRGSDYFLPEAVLRSPIAAGVIDILDESFRLYDKMVADGIPKEDARYVLPLYALTDTTPMGDARELTHLHAMNDQGEVPSITKYVVEEMISKAKRVARSLMKRRESNYETLAWFPAAQLFATRNRTMNRIIESHGAPKRSMFASFMPDSETIMKAVRDRDEAELANLKHMHNGGPIEGFLVYLSITALHQMIRQRTLNQTVESVYDAAERGESFIPRTIKASDYADKYNEQAIRMINLNKKLVACGVLRSEAIGVAPHSLMIYDLLHVNGWNAIHFIGKRMCKEAQLEIRIIAGQIAELIKARSPVLGRFIAPQGELYGKCPEERPCGLCKGISNPPKKPQERD
jgi:thymidylate synthase (FAD)